jgi:sterol desaturase/sphingolipid hydroxylase (fatty acid hydroxylase superfamily)
VTNEILALTKCTLATIALLAFSVQLGLYGYSSLFDVGKATWQQNAVNFAISFWVVDFYSYFYHYIGHKIPEAWAIHRFHHKFYNPTPYGVIADDMLDQVVRAMPLLFLPLALDSLNWVVLSAVFGCDMYYGILLHSGHENAPARKIADFFEGACGVDLINTPLNHFLHHAISGGSTPKYCGFYVTVWDKLFGSEDKEGLAKFLQGLEGRTEAEFKTIELPQYEQLGSVGHWVEAIKSGGLKQTKAA